MRANRLRHLLDQGRPTLGTHVMVPWPGIVEVIGRTGGFDYIELVGEYTPWSLQLLDDFGRAIELFPDLSAMMKVDEHHRGFIATRSADAGFSSLLFTDCRSAQDVRDCIRIVRSEHPDSGGTHGAGMRRIVGYGNYGSPQEWVDAMDQIVVAIMIEKQGAIDHLEQILEVEGLDMVQFGPVDYAVSVGKADSVGSPEMLAVEERMIAQALAAGVQPRVEIASADQAKRYLDLGVRHFCVGWDLRTISTWCREQSEAMSAVLDR